MPKGSAKDKRSKYDSVIAYNEIEREIQVSKKLLPSLQTMKARLLSDLKSAGKLRIS